MKTITIFQLDKGNIKTSSTFEYTEQRFNTLNSFKNFLTLIEDTSSSTIFIGKDSKNYNTVIWRGFVRPYLQEDKMNLIPD